MYTVCIYTLYTFSIHVLYQVGVGIRNGMDEELVLFITALKLVPVGTDLENSSKFRNPI